MAKKPAPKPPLKGKKKPKPAPPKPPAAPAASSTGPIDVTIRSYQVGFGDCFLLSFRYASGVKRVLIDCGSTEAPAAFKGDLLMRVAQDIKTTCGDRIDAVVATHRHADHINGFETGTQKTPKSGDVLRSLKPALVIQPWTEDPDAQPDAKGPTRVLADAKAFVASLASMHEFSRHLLMHLNGSDPIQGLTKKARKQLAFHGADNLANRSAVENLMTMAADPSGQKYLSFGKESSLGDLLPGVRVHVLGPPTVEQSETITKQTAKSKSEFWQLAAATIAGGRGGSGGKLFPRARTMSPPEYARWLIPRIKELRGDQLLQLVRMLDAQMNNTSVILLFEFGRQKLLFPGDAQLENWMYALKGDPEDPKSTARAEQTRAMLADTTLYKVGHHGSLNATPKTLWNLFKRRSKADSPDRLVTMVSTMAGKHGSDADHTEVPRKTLVDALSTETRFFTTQNLKSKKEPFLDVTLPA